MSRVQMYIFITQLSYIVKAIGYHIIIVTKSLASHILILKQIVYMYMYLCLPAAPAMLKLPVAIVRATSKQPNAS